MLIIDHDEEVFSIDGPVVDDTQTTYEVIRRQKSGRSISCQAISTEQSLADIARSYSNQSGYAYNSLTILGDSDSRRAIVPCPRYTGKVPNYASGADRKKLLKILYKGRCNMARWAVMNEGFPGMDRLRRSHLGDFQATCLMCGKIANDSYNWIR